MDDKAKDVAEKGARTLKRKKARHARQQIQPWDSINLKKLRTAAAEPRPRQSTETSGPFTMNREASIVVDQHYENFDSLEELIAPWHRK